MKSQPKKNLEKPENPKVLKLQLAIGNAFKSLRKSRGYTNYESFANAVELNRSQYGKYEAGRTNMRIGALLETAFKLGLDEADIFNEEFLTLGMADNSLMDRNKTQFIQQVRHEVSLIVGTRKANEFDDSDIERMHLILTTGLNQVSKNEIVKKIKLKGPTPSFEDLLDFLMDSKWFSMTHPENPNRPDQKYYTTETGKTVLKLGK